MSIIVAYIDDDRITFDSDCDVTQHNDGITEINSDLGGYIMFEDSDQAGYLAREYWKNLAEHDPKEFTCLVGTDTLIQWGLGNWAGPGPTQVQSLSEWLDLWLDTPEEHWASYDGNECSFVCKHPDFSMYTVAYRTN